MPKVRESQGKSQGILKSRSHGNPALVKSRSDFANRSSPPFVLFVFISVAKNISPVCQTKFETKLPDRKLITTKLKSIRREHRHTVDFSYS